MYDIALTLAISNMAISMVISMVLSKAVSMVNLLMGDTPLSADGYSTRCNVLFSWGKQIGGYSIGRNKRENDVNAVFKTR